jgi:putative ABC transport system substrate-binding protein
LNTDLTPKLLEFLREILPKATVLAVIFNPSNPTNPVLMENLRAKASPLGITVLPFATKSPGDFDVVFPELVARHPDALQVIADPLLNDLGHRIAELALANGLPTFTNNEWSAETSGLISYGASVRKVLYRMGYYVKKILDGANPGDLPVEQPTKIELIINLKTAKTLGIEISPTLLIRADRVIE